MGFVPNPAAEANLGFDVVQPGTYRMRVKSITDKKKDGSMLISEKGNRYYKVELEYVDPTALLKIDGSPVKNAGILFDNGLIYEPTEQQGRLRGFVESCGVRWEDSGDEQSLVGCEVDVKVKIEEYKGEQSNKVSRYLQPK